VRRCILEAIALAVLLLLLAGAVSACGSSDPYSGTWKAVPTSHNGALTFVIHKANPGWWSIRNGDVPGGASYGVDMNGMLQTGNGSMTFKPSGDKLGATLAPGTPTIELTKQ
jgi:hypothetical protein